MGTPTRTILAATTAAIALWLAPAASADTFKVNVLGDPSPGACTNSHCSLREAVLRANNQSAGRDTVVLPSRRKPYVLRIENETTAGDDGSLTGDLDVTNEALVIKHSGKGLATIDAHGIDRAIQAFSNLTLKRIRIKGGDATNNSSNDSGGGVRAEARLKLIDSQVRGNLGDHGGGIAAEGGRLTVIRTLVSGNTDTDAGGGIYMYNANGRIADSRILANHVINDDEAGGINLYDADLTIKRTTIARNTSDREGGGIVASVSTLRIEASTISGNRAQAGGGGIYLQDGSTTILNSTIAGNRTVAEGGGITLLGSATLNLNGVTVARNLANSDDDPLSETGGGLANDSTGEILVRNSIIALNTLGPGAPNDCTGEPFASTGGNLLSTIGPSDVCFGFEGPGDAFRPNPKLGKLGKHGGPTETIPLRAGSPAIGRARNSAPPRDQRGHKRDGDPDSGAYER